MDSLLKVLVRILGAIKQKCVKDRVANDRFLDRAPKDRLAGVTVDAFLPFVAVLDHASIPGASSPFWVCLTERSRTSSSLILDWYCWTEQSGGGLADRGDLVAREATTGTYEATIREIFRKDRFDMGCWVSAV